MFVRVVCTVATARVVRSSRCFVTACHVIMSTSEIASAHTCVSPSVRQVPTLDTTSSANSNSSAILPRAKVASPGSPTHVSGTAATRDASRPICSSVDTRQCAAKQHPAAPRLHPAGGARPTTTSK